MQSSDPLASPLGGIFGVLHPMAHAPVYRTTQKPRRAQPPKVTWQAGSVVRVGAGFTVLTIDSLAARPGPISPRNRDGGRWSVARYRPRSIDARGTRACRYILSQLTRGRLCYAILRVMNHVRVRASRRFSNPFVARGSHLEI